MSETLLEREQKRAKKKHRVGCNFQQADEKRDILEVDVANRVGRRLE